ncbi:MAG: DUF1289 domain-containing protein [Rhizobiales bacterium]|nr:DUF1289 domain-containing protein [Rhodobiaceae bacterium]MBL6623979.1 DUF1289 domain-containing protein [Hyphomicrobiales bacterium]MBL6770038.1 DUF1289 domain-containing protein [Hyphomicrobiales bacterium]RPF97257.1 MAG: DUF1289 domain-containing protein [Rhizobiales bacterium TMED227]|tara:strand:+ start:3609 stop:3872 length:264 start_codon:yes stop_codon:yes gene_type:complete
MSDFDIISPCINVCKWDPITGYCYGCGRTQKEKNIWRDENTSIEWKTKNLSDIEQRLNGWQKTAFQESYKSKKVTGNSLIKERKLAQ